MKDPPDCFDQRSVSEQIPFFCTFSSLKGSKQTTTTTTTCQTDPDRVLQDRTQPTKERTNERTGKSSNIHEDIDQHDVCRTERVWVEVCTSDTLMERTESSKHQRCSGPDLELHVLGRCNTKKTLAVSPCVPRGRRDLTVIRD